MNRFGSGRSRLRRRWKFCQPPVMMCYLPAKSRAGICH